MKKQNSMFEFSDKRKNQIKTEKPTNQWNFIWFTLFILFATGFLAYYFFFPKEQVYNLKNYSTGELSKSSISETALASGKLVPRKLINISVPANGKLIEVLTSSGDGIKKGNIIARVQSYELLGQFRNAQNAVKISSENFNQALIHDRKEISDRKTDAQFFKIKENQIKSDLKTVKETFLLGGSAKNDVIKLENDLRIAENDTKKSIQSLSDTQALQDISHTVLKRAIQDANDNLSLIRQNMAGLVIKASVDGQVLTVKAAEGDDVRLGDLLFTIADTRKMRIDADVDEATAARVKVGQPVNILIGEITFKGEISQVAPQANTGQNGSSVPIQVQFLGTVPKLRPNISASLEILLNVKKDVLSLPRAPFLTTGGERLVYVITAADTAERREVVFGVSNAERVEVVSGLQLGDKVITSSMEAYKDQVKIQISPTGALK
jgi:HlyD family secretion protein